MRPMKKIGEYYWIAIGAAVGAAFSSLVLRMGKSNGHGARGEGGLLMMQHRKRQ
jgi:hypothetical protein